MVEPGADTQDDGQDTYSFGIVRVAPSLPFALTFRFPFTRHYVQLGKDSLSRLRKQVRRNPDDPAAHITLAAHLMSESQVLPNHAEEAVEELRTALRLLPADDAVDEENAQQNAMVHKFLGDALIVLGQRAEARKHWQSTVALDPVRPPYGFSGPAQEALDQHPEQQTRTQKTESATELRTGMLTVAMKNLLDDLQGWYEAQCDGDWEHSYGITIETLDNPGWSVRINLEGTGLEDVPFTEIEIDADQGTKHWLRCRRCGNTFVGFGSPDKLQTILDIFLMWAASSTPTKEN